ncbi:STAS domain-containing protein [Tessaracoccus terricola]
MNLTTDHRDGYAVVAVTGRFTAAGAPQLRQAAGDVVAAGKCRIVVDLAGCTFIDSSGLGALISALKAARVAGGDLKIAAAPDNVLSVLRLTNLDRVLHNHPTPESAFDGR